MGKYKIKTDEMRRTYIPPELVQDGFSGEMEIIADFDAFLVKKPTSSWKKVKESLKILMHDVERRIEEESK